MGGLCDSSPAAVPSTTTVVSGTSIPEWVSEGGQRLFGEAEALARKPYQPYSGPRIAGLSENEQGAISSASENAGGYADDISSARSLIDSGGRSWTDPGVSESYINPYARGVTDIAARETERRNLASQPQRGAAAVSAGAFGGARHGVNDSENRRNLDQQIADIYLRGGAEAWNAGQGAFNADASRQVQAGGAFRSIAESEQGLQTRDISNLMTTGGLERNLEQASLDTAREDFQEQREWPYRQLNFALGALSGSPYEVEQNQTTTGQTLVPQQGALQQAAGVGLAGAGIYSLLQ